MGKYAITFHFADGEAKGSFTVSNQYDATNPTTGDSIFTWVAVMLGSLAALGGAAFVLRKSSRK